MAEVVVGQPVTLGIDRIDHEVGEARAGPEVLEVHDLERPSALTAAMYVLGRIEEVVDHDIWRELSELVHQGLPGLHDDRMVASGDGRGRQLAVAVDQESDPVPCQGVSDGQRVVGMSQPDRLVTCDDEQDVAAAKLPLAQRPVVDAVDVDRLAPSTTITPTERPIRSSGVMEARLDANTPPVSRNVRGSCCRLRRAS